MENDESAEMIEHTLRKVLTIQLKSLKPTGLDNLVSGLLNDLKKRSPDDFYADDRLSPEAKRTLSFFVIQARREQEQRIKKAKQDGIEITSNDLRKAFIFMFPDLTLPGVIKRVGDPSWYDIEDLSEVGISVELIYRALRETAHECLLRCVSEDEMSDEAWMELLTGELYKRLGIEEEA